MLKAESARVIMNFERKSNFFSCIDKRKYDESLIKNLNFRNVSETFLEHSIWISKEVSWSCHFGHKNAPPPPKKKKKKKNHNKKLFELRKSKTCLNIFILNKSKIMLFRHMLIWEHAFLHIWAKITFFKMYGQSEAMTYMYSHSLCSFGNL